jgi:Holliday junction resolvasome RuvABC DNA-binding subunit
MGEGGCASPPHPPPPPPPAADGEEDPRSLAREGLLNLGYQPAEAERLLAEAEGETPEEIVQAALRRAAGARAA